MKNIGYILLASALLLASCTKESVRNTYNKQEQNIESFINGQMQSNESARIVKNGGSIRLVIQEGEGEELGEDGIVSFLYAGYVLNSASINQSNLFATNNKEYAESIKWSVSDSTAFDIVTVRLRDADFVEGLQKGIKGVKAGEECYILFSGKYGYGSKAFGTIPANSALAYHVWVESLSE